MKKVKIFLLIFILLIILLGITIYCIDKSRMRNNKPVLFSTWGAEYAPPVNFSDKKDDKEPDKYTDLKNLPEDYNADQAISDKCFVIGISLYNKDVLDNFLKNTENNIKDELRIVQFTVEGDLIITNIKLTEDNIIVEHDNTRDKFSRSEDRIITTKTYNKSEGNLKLIERTVEKNIYVDLILQLNSVEEWQSQPMNSITLCTYKKDSKVIENSKTFTATIVENSNNKVLRVKSLTDTLFVKQGEEIDIHLEPNSDELYEKDKKISITLTDDATILETYPAQIPTGSIQKIEVIN